MVCSVVGIIGEGGGYRFGVELWIRWSLLFGMLFATIFVRGDRKKYSISSL